MFFKVNGLYILQICLPGLDYLSVCTGVYAMTYDVISWLK